MSLLLLSLACTLDFPTWSAPAGTTGDTRSTGATAAPTGATADTSTRATGGTASTTGVTGDTGEPIEPSDCTFSLVAGSATDVISPVLAPLAQINLHGTAAPLSGAGPAGEDVIWFDHEQDGVQRLYLDASGTSQVDAFPSVHSPNDSLHGSTTPTGSYLLLHNANDDLFVYDGQGGLIGRLWPFEKVYGGVCTRSVFDAIVLPSFVLTPGDHVVFACYESSDSSLRSRRVDAFGGTGAIAPTGDEVVRFDALAAGYVGQAWHAMAQRVHPGDTEVWVGDASDTYDPHRVHLVRAPPKATVTQVDSAADVRLTLRGPVRPGATPLPASVDLDGDGADDVLTTMPSAAGGELWVVFDVEAQAVGTQLVRDDIDLVVLGGSVLSVVDGLAVVPHATGAPSVIVSGSDLSGTPAAALLPPGSLPASGEVALDALSPVVVRRNDGQGSLWDVQPAGDLDGDGCGDVLVHIADSPGYGLAGAGTGYVLSGH